MFDHSVVLELARRALQQSETKTIYARDGSRSDHPFTKITPGGLIGLLVLIITFVFVLFCFRYTCWGVIGTLAFVEKDSAGSEIDIEGPPAYDDVAGEIVNPESSMLGHTTSATVTSSVRRALRHLRGISGLRSLFRGFMCFAAYHVITGIVALVFTNVFYALAFGHLWILAQIAGGIIASVLLIQVSTAWTHVVISEPSPKGWNRRLPPFRRTLKNLWLVTVVNEVCGRISILVPLAVAMAVGLVDPKHIEAPKAAIGGVIGVAVLSFVLFVLLVLPSGMALARAQASMLPEEDETIVAFDRSFGGKVEPAIVGGSGALGLVDAWKTVDRAARLRVLKLFAKFVAVEVVLHVAFGVAFAVILLTCSVKTKQGSS